MGTAMTIEDIFRRIIKAHLAIIVFCTLAPLVAVLVLQSQSSPTWVAKVRLQVLSSAPSSTTQADGLSSRVLALATTPSLVQTAVSDAHVNADAEQLAAHQVSAERLGESSVVELAVTDSDSADAAALVEALSKQVAQFMNEGDRDRFNNALAQLDGQISKAQAHRDGLVNQLQLISGPLARENMRVRIDTAQATLSQLVDQRATMILDDVSRDQVVVLDADAPTVLQQPSPLLPRAALGLLLGLVLGLTLSLLAETLRPRVAGIRALARLLHAPVLGTTKEPVAALAHAMTLTARRQGVETVVLLGVEERDVRASRQLLASLPRSWSSPADLSAQVEQAGRLGVTTTRSVMDDEDRIEPADTDFDGAYDGPTEPSRTGHVSLSHNVRFTDLYGVGPNEEPSAGVLVVCSGTALQSRLDTLDDVLTSMRWPVVGIVENTARRGWAGRR
jgi:capsular polysaccharide biosynthesis protein